MKPIQAVKQNSFKSNITKLLNEAVIPELQSNIANLPLFELDLISNGYITGGCIQRLHWENSTAGGDIDIIPSNMQAGERIKLYDLYEGNSENRLSNLEEIQVSSGRASLKKHHLLSKSYSTHGSEDESSGSLFLEVQRDKGDIRHYTFSNNAITFKNKYQMIIRYNESPHTPTPNFPSKFDMVHNMVYYNLRENELVCKPLAEWSITNKVIIPNLNTLSDLVPNRVAKYINQGWRWMGHKAGMELLLDSPYAKLMFEFDKKKHKIPLDVQEYLKNLDYLF